MGFDICLNGEVIHTVDIDPRLVTGAHLFTAAGEAGTAGLPLNGDKINIELDYQLPSALPVQEDDARIAASQAAEENPVPLTHNVNARRMEALTIVDAVFAEKASETDEDLSTEYALARQKVIEDPSTMNEILTDIDAKLGTSSDSSTSEPATSTDTQAGDAAPVSGSGTETSAAAPGDTNVETQNNDQLSNVAQGGGTAATQGNAPDVPAPDVSFSQTGTTGEVTQ